MDDDAEERLRRRLYAPGASQADLDAYRAVEPPGTIEHPADDDATRSAPSARAVRAVIALAAVGVLALGALVVAHLPPPDRMSPSRTRAAATPEVDAGEVSVPASARAGFLAALGSGADPHLLEYLDAHPSALLTRLRGAGRLDTARFAGIGSATIALPSAGRAGAAERSGRLTVVLVTDRAGRFRWQATRVAMRNDRSGPDAPVAAHDGTARAGVPVSGTVVHRGGVPTRLTVLLPTGVRWAAVVVLSG